MNFLTHVKPKGETREQGAGEKKKESKQRDAGCWARVKGVSRGISAAGPRSPCAPARALSLATNEAISCLRRGFDLSFPASRISLSSRTSPPEKSRGAETANAARPEAAAGLGAGSGRRKGAARGGSELTAEGRKERRFGQAQGCGARSPGEELRARVPLP